MNRTKYVKLYIGIILLILSISFFSIGTYRYIKINNPDIIITQEIKLSNIQVTNVENQTYRVHLTGEIKNKSEHTYRNVRIDLKFEQDVICDVKYQTINIDTLDPNSNHSINATFNTKGNPLGIEKATCNVGDKTYELKTDGEFYFSLAETLALVGAIILLPLGLILTISSLPKRDKTKQQKIINTTPAPDNNNINVNVTVSIPEVNNSPQFVFCQYCGAKNNKNNTKCDNCGSSLNE